MLFPLETAVEIPQPVSERMEMFSNFTLSIRQPPCEGFCQTEIGRPYGRMLSITMSWKEMSEMVPEVVPPEGYWLMQSPPLSSEA